MNQTLDVLFVGGGNMARALIAGLVAGGMPAEHIGAVEPDPGRAADLARDFGVQVSPDAAALAGSAAAVVLAVKPQVMPAVARALGPLLARPAPLVISIAAGIRAGALSRWLGTTGPLVRCMPNTPALVRAGITALYAGPDVNDTQRAAAQRILAAVGETVWVDGEAALDAVTAVSGSGPAYYFLLTEALEQAGIGLGLDAATARRLAVHTARGAGLLAAQDGADPAVLRAQVTSPGGTTQAALGVLEDGRLRALLDRAVQAAAVRSRELADQADAP